MIKRVRIPEVITLERFCDENDLTIILTSYKNVSGLDCVRAKISEPECVGSNEEMALRMLATQLSEKDKWINGRKVKFPRLRCY